MMALGLATGEELEVVLNVENGDWMEAAVVTTTTGFSGMEVLTGGEVSVEVTVGLGKKDVGDAVTSVPTGLMAQLALPHSASTSAMMSPPPEMESKVRSEEMSASKLLRLVSPGIMGGSEVGKGGTCSLVLLTLPAVIWGVIVSDGDVAELSCDVKLLTGSSLHVSGLSRERG